MELDQPSGGSLIVGSAVRPEGARSAFFVALEALTESIDYWAAQAITPRPNLIGDDTLKPQSDYGN